MSTTWADVYKLESTMPLWLAEYLLFNKIPGPPAVKVSFVLLPWAGTDSGYDVLPELLNSLVDLFKPRIAYSNRKCFLFFSFLLSSFFPKQVTD